MRIIIQNIRRVFLYILVIAQSITIAQVPMEKVLLEMGTATWNAACASEVQIINQMKEEGLSISVINYHLNDPYANQHANQRASYYNIQNLPFPVVGGELAEIGNYDSYLNLYNESFNTPSSFSISVNGYFIEDSLIVEMEIEKLAVYDSDLISFYLAVTESDIQVNWQGLNKIDEVERGMTPDGNGISLDFSAVSTINLSGKIFFEREWNPENMEMVAFIQDDTAKNILQCHSQLITNFAPLPVHAFFEVEDTLTCVNEYVSFQNTSTGDVENVQWVFSGGSPAESNDYNPIVQYQDEGPFEVQLIISNSVSTDTLIVANYIHVSALPTVTFDALPDFCHNHIAYQLTEGYPLGGNYLGLFIDTGYFHPEASGLGAHPIYYAFQDEETGCSDTLSQDAMVYFCESIDDISKNAYDFPFRISTSSNEILFTEREANKILINEIQVYNIKGELLFQQTYPQNKNKLVVFSLPKNNPLLLIHVHSLKESYLFKYQIMQR